MPPLSSSRLPAKFVDCLRRVPVLLLFSSALASGALAFGAESGNIAARRDYSAVAAALTQFIQQELAQKQIPALSIALVDGHETVWAQGFGYADPGRRIPATAETVYRVGSVSKLFTDIGIMQLVERGQLDLDAPIEKVLPDFRPRNPFGAPITLRELMSHRSGLLYLPPDGNAFDPASPPLADVVRSLNNTVLVYPPGTHTKYSNAGVTVAGYALERVAGAPLAVYLKRAVLDPEGLKSSGFERTPELTHNLAKAFMWTYDGRVFPAPTFDVGIFPAAGMYSTVADLGRFMAMVFDGGRGPGGQVLKPETLRDMWTPRPDQNSWSPFGIGFELGSLDGHRLVGHHGEIYGFTTLLDALVDDQLGAVAVTTLDSSTGVTDRIVHEALRLMLAARARKTLPEILTPTPVGPDLARRLEGRYRVSGQSVFDLTERYGRLFSLPFQGSYETELRRLGNSLIVDDRLRYGEKFPLEEGAVPAGLLGFERINAPKPPPAPSDWAGLIGEYGWDHNVLYILERDGNLTALIEWFEYDPLRQDSENIFSFPDFGLHDHEKATFVRNAQGYATQVCIGGVVFKRRPLAGELNPVFSIKPRKPVEELRREALAAHPPHESGETLKPDLVELVKLDPTIKLDIRYASTRNFLSTPMYQQARAFMQRPAAEAVVRANGKLKALGYGLLIHDAYRPWYVTKMFWDATPEPDHIFVADPQEGSRHNRGCAVDLTLYDLTTGEPAPMVGGYDEMSERSFPFYPGGTSLQRWDRRLLRHAMEDEGFTVYDFEWWHFDYKDWRKYPILNVAFDEIQSGE
jgi:CubicO group peptidase (beta-lactamase class C family)/D-alanyl-D-alanine dipeptidase